MVSFRPWLAIIALLLLSTPVGAEKCNCNTWPFEPDPPCFDQCAAKLLSEAEMSRLAIVFNFPSEMESIIREIKQYAAIPKALSSVLSPSEYRYAEKQIRSIGKKGFDYLREKRN